MSHNPNLVWCQTSHNLHASNLWNIYLSCLHFQSPFNKGKDLYSSYVDFKNRIFLHLLFKQISICNLVRSRTVHTNLGVLTFHSKIPFLQYNSRMIAEICLQSRKFGKQNWSKEASSVPADWANSHPLFPLAPTKVLEEKSFRFRNSLLHYIKHSDRVSLQFFVQNRKSTSVPTRGICSESWLSSMAFGH